MNYDELKNKVIQQDERIKELEEKEADLLKKVNTSIRNFVGTFRVRSGDIKSGNYVAGKQGWRLTPEMAYLPSTIIDGYIQVGKAADDINTGTTIIEGSKITIDGGSNFGVGYDPSTKLDSDDVGDMAYEDVVEWAKLGTTIVDGAYIKTGVIDASRIDTGYLSADRISAKSITGTKLADGTITPVKISYLDADDITAGTLTGRVVRTSSGTTRVEMNTSNELVLYQNGYERTVLGNGMLWFGTTSGVGSAALYGFGTNTLAISTGSYGYLMNETQFYPMSSSATLGTTSYRWNWLYATQIQTDAIVPRVTDYYACGNSSYYWYQVYAHYYMAKDSSFHSFDKHDDIKLLKNVSTKIRKEKRLEGKKEVEKDVEYFDLSNIPEVKGEGDTVNVNAVNGLLIGTVKQLIEKVETLEDKINNLKNK